MLLPTRIKTALAVLAGKASVPEPGASPPPESPAIAAGQEPGDPEAALAALRLELAERDRRIEALLKEADELRDAAADEARSAAGERMGKLLRRLAPLLAQADAMRRFEAEGKPLRTADAFALFEKIEKALAGEGVGRIGETGAETVFDQSLHQRLSGGDVRPGDAVRVRFVGFRQGERILAKALVSRKEDGDAPGH